MKIILKTLDLFNFGNDIKHRIKIFYTNTENAVQNNGFITSWFQPSKGVRQGWGDGKVIEISLWI